MGNNALNVNGDTVNGGTAGIHITTHGSDWYWAVTAVMFISTFVFWGLAFTRPRSHRIFHYITAGITLVASIAYFTMGSNLGFTPIHVEFMRSNPKVAGSYREIFYVRYIDWFITTPLLLLDLLLTAGLPWPTILYTILMDWIMVVCGLVGALVVSSYKWAYFVFGCVAFFFVAYNVGWVARKHAQALGSDVHRTFLICGVWTLSLWCLYPIAWGLCEGGNVISPDSEAVFYGILDLMAKPVFGALLIWGHRNIDQERLGLYIRDYDEVPPTRGGYGEKHNVGNGATNNGAANGTGVTTGVNYDTTGANYDNTAGSGAAITGSTYPNTAPALGNERV
ncbi:ion channel activity [Hypocenomyce scalaris]|nr:ion channel activity [Hypocenomyce scalaris]